MRLRFVAATAVAALLGVAACSAAPRTVSIRSAGDSTPLAADPVPVATVDPTAATVEQPTVTTAPTATTVATVATATTQPTSSTTAAVTATTAPVTVSTVQPVTATTAAVTATTAVTPTTVVTLTQVPSLMIAGWFAAQPGGCPLADVFTYAIDPTALTATLATQGLAAPAALFTDKNGATVAAGSRNLGGAQKAVDECASAAGGPLEASLIVPSSALPLAQAVKAQVEGLNLKNFRGLTLTPQP